MDVSLAVLAFSGAIVGIGRKAASGFLDRRAQRWLAEVDAAEGPYVHLARGVTLPDRAAPVRPADAARAPRTPATFGPAPAAR